MEESVKKIEWIWERKERQKRKRNVIVKGFKRERKEVRSEKGRSGESGGEIRDGGKGR